MEPTTPESPNPDRLSPIPISSDAVFWFLFWFGRWFDPNPDDMTTPIEKADYPKSIQIS
jgi:hypothetical protein